MSRAVLVDMTRCIGCRSCQVACKAWNDNAAETTQMVGRYDNPPHTTANTFTKVAFNEVVTAAQLHWVFAKQQCMHCEHPACVSVCPVGAFQKLATGPVVYDPTRCVGCRYCMTACPFNMPKYEWDSATPQVRKCSFCADRQSQGLEPACVKACPTGALTSGERSDLIAQAHGRIQARPAKYVDRVYGEHEAGGTAWLYLSPTPFEDLGFPSLSEHAVTAWSETAMAATPGVFVGAAALLGGIYWFTKRRAAGSRPPAEKKEA